MKITISTGYNGHHQDWLIFQEQLDDTQMFDYAMTDLEAYLDSVDGKVDSGGPISEQVRTMVLDLADGKRDRPWNVTLAVSNSEDMDVFIKAEPVDE